MARAHAANGAGEQRDTQRKIVVVDDHPLIRDALKVMISCLPRWRFVGEASTARDALVLVSAQMPDVVLMDIAMPGMDGIIATREILRRSPLTRVLVLTGYVDLWDVREALAAGAAGYLLKGDSQSLDKALEAVIRGERYLSPDVVSRLAASKDETRATNVLASLSEREKEVFRLAAECLNNGRIARELCIARKTVDTHLYRIHRKLGVRTSAELVRLAMSLGVVHSGRLRSSGATVGDAPSAGLNGAGASAQP